MMIKLFSRHLINNNVSKLSTNELMRNYSIKLQSNNVKLTTRQFSNKQSNENQTTKTIEIEPPITEQPHNDLGHFDIVINGGGIVGLTFLLNLQCNTFLKHKRVLLIEQQNPSKSPTQSTGQRVLSNRVSTLTEASRRCFEENGVWSEIDEFTKRIREMQIWSSDLSKAISFDTFGLDESSNVAYVVENNIILNALNRNLNHDQVLYSTNVAEILEIDNQIHLYTKSKTDSTVSKLSCSLLIGCDGYNSLVRHKSNLKYFSLPLEQNGVVGTVRMDQVDENNLDNSISFQRFLPDRTVVAILPLTNTESSFVISTSKEFAKRLVEMNENGLLKSLIDYYIAKLKMVYQT